MVRATIFVSAFIALVATVSAAPRPGGGHNDVDIKEKKVGLIDVTLDHVVNDVIDLNDLTVKDIAQDINILSEDNGSNYDSDNNGAIAGYKHKHEDPVTGTVFHRHAHDHQDHHDHHGHHGHRDNRDNRDNQDCDDDDYLTKRGEAAVEADVPTVRISKKLGAKAKKMNANKMA
ncbi:MAG: hypothetical protein EXX96DRAFT_545757 [Benjaminiella poitrasii]|nr:MAG: hypothetical protein EXX96DRAFT_545757 [Benjaminiella poitrasii]